MATVTYYFNSYNVGEAWSDTPENMVDGDTGTFTGWEGDTLTQLLDGNNCDGTNLGTISKVELRMYGVLSSSPTDAQLRAVFNGADDGDNHVADLWVAEGWGDTINITTDTNAPGTWNWTHVQNLDCDVDTVIAGGSVRGAKVEIIVTYTPGGGDPQVGAGDRRRIITIASNN